MDDPRVLKLITVGLVLAAIVVGYFLWTGRFAGTSTRNAANNNTRVAQNTATPTPTPFVTATPSPIVTPEPATLGPSSNNQNVATLPATGSPLFLLGALSASAMVAGFYLRKYSN